MKVRVTTLKFELEDKLPLSYGHKLRGYFANNFKEVLFHQHKKDGSLRYKYPLIQYKIINNKPVILGLGEGAELIINKFLKIDVLKLGDKEYFYPSGNLKVEEIELFVETDYDMPTFKYTFISPWLGLSQKNYQEYKNKIVNKSKKAKMSFLKRILIGNILSLAKGLDWWIEEKVVVVPKLEEVPVKFKGQQMIGFTGELYSNVNLPEHIGLGKSSSRGFGTIIKESLV